MIPAVPVRRQRGRWREDLPGTPWRWLLAPAWSGFAAGAQLRRLAWDHLLRPTAVGCPVIGIGNVVAGGAGKTPVAIQVAARLAAWGLAPTIVSRGYRAGHDGRNEEAQLAGSIPVVCDADRIRGARTAISAGARSVVLDDGFQHRRLHRDLDLVVVDSTRPWGESDGSDGWMLPMGYRREPLTALARAGAIWLTRADLADARAERAIRDRLAAHPVTARIPILRERIRGFRWDPVIPTGPVLLVSGIGNPHGFTLAALAAGVQAAEHWTYPDHHHYDRADAGAIAARAAAIGATVVTTGKDAVKLAPLLAVTVLAVDAALDPDDAARLDLLLRQCLGPAAPSDPGPGPGTI